MDMGDYLLIEIKCCACTVCIQRDYSAKTATLPGHVHTDVKTKLSHPPSNEITSYSLMAAVFHEDAGTVKECTVHSTLLMGFTLSGYVFVVLCLFEFYGNLTLLYA